MPEEQPVPTDFATLLENQIAEVKAKVEMGLAGGGHDKAVSKEARLVSDTENVLREARVHIGTLGGIQDLIRLRGETLSAQDKTNLRGQVVTTTRALIDHNTYFPHREEIRQFAQKANWSPDVIQEIWGPETTE